MTDALYAWMREFPAAVTVCDRDGIILEMNDKSAQTFASDGGYELVGRNLLDCHPEPARSKLAGMLAAGRPNTYTIEKNGIKKLIHQTPWCRDGRYAGFVEFSFEIPFDLPHHLHD